MKEKICSSCGYEGKPVAQSKMSFIVDLVIWMVTFNLVAMSGILPLFLIPVSWTVYHIVRFNSVQCPKCERLDMVSKRSHKGKLAKTREENLHIWTADNKTSSAH